MRNAGLIENGDGSWFSHNIIAVLTGGNGETDDAPLKVVIGGTVEVATGPMAPPSKRWGFVVVVDDDNTLATYTLGTDGDITPSSASYGDGVRAASDGGDANVHPHTERPRTTRSGQGPRSSKETHG